MSTQQVLKTTDAQVAPEKYTPSEDERTLVMKVYSDFIYDQSIKSQGWDVLNGRTLTQFWNDSNRDYNQIVDQQENNPVTQYSSGITRDKANTFITNLTLQLLYPSVSAFNTAQEKDITISTIARPLMKWQYLNDGRPAESGKVKNVRYTHKQVVEGTVHILDTVGPDGKLTSTCIPNEEVFVPNFFQPNVQLQGHFMQVQQWASFSETSAEYGDLPNFKYVTPGSLGWLTQTFEFKERYKSLIYDNQCTVVRFWYPVKQSEVDRLKKEGKLPQHVTKAKYFNILINDVLMFPPDNLMPYHHGDFPVTKAILESFSPAEYYWGNSMPNKAMQDKKYLDGFKTLVRYKAKLSAAPSYLNTSGQHIENDIFVPGTITDLPSSFDPKNFIAVPGTDKGATNSDAMILKDTLEDIERSTASPQTAGQQGGDRQTARESMIIEQNAQKTMMSLSQQIAFREEARTFPILKSTFQFLPRQAIKKLAIPDETFSDGSTGTLEIIFDKLPDMTEEEKMEASFKVREKETKGRQRGNYFKQVTVDPEYIQNLEFYCEAIADQLPAVTSAMREAKAEYKWNIYAARPDMFNQTRAARQLVRELGDNEKEMIIDQQAALQMPLDPNQMPGNGNNPIKQMSPSKSNSLKTSNQLV